MRWVWNHSRTKGNARLVVLAIADKARGADWSARMGTTELCRRLNASRSTVIEAVDRALASGELCIVRPAAGSRAAEYQLTAATAEWTQQPPATGPVSRPQPPGDRSGNRTPTPDEGSDFPTTKPDGGSDFPTTTPPARGPESGPGGSDFPTTCGSESGPLNQPTRAAKPAGQQETSDRLTEGPRRDLVDQITIAGVHDIRWNLTRQEWAEVDRLIARSGAPALAAYAAKVADRSSSRTARYFLPGWRELPPLPDPSAGRPALRAVGGTAWQPYTNPQEQDWSVYENGF